MTRLAGCVLFAVTLTGAPAAAVCRSASECLCKRQEAIAEIRVTGVEEARTTFVVEAVHGTTARTAVGDSQVLPRMPEDDIDKRSLLFLLGDEGWERTVVHDDGQILCERADPPLLVPVADAVEISLSADCEERLVERGFREPPCNDTGPCSAAPGIVPAAMLLLLITGARRRTRG